MAELTVPATLVLVESVIIFLYQRSKCSTKFVDELERAKSCLEKLQAYLTDSKLDQIDCSMDSSFLMVAHGIADAVDEFMFQVPDLFRGKKESEWWFSNQTRQPVYDFTRLLQPIKALPFKENKPIKVNKCFDNLSSKIKEKIELVKALNMRIPHGGSQSRPDDNLTLQIPEEDEILCFEEPKEKLLKQLMETDSRLLKISIVVGPGGSGKTTLVKNLLNVEMIQQFFECCDWIDVSRGPRPLNLGAKFTLLQQKRFLLVLENVWSKQCLEGILSSLPEGLHGSKVIIITCNSNVASLPVKSSEYIHDLSTGLSLKQSFDLLCKRAFRNGKCPQMLVEWSEKIVKKCEGSPSAISAIGTYLAREPQTEDYWKQFHDRLGSQIKGDSNFLNLSVILEPSYRHLPSHLKTCFLYIGIFCEDQPIPRQRLINLWVAEGFVEPMAGLTQEKVGEQYLNELVARNLVHVSYREIHGRVRSCRVSDLFRWLIISKNFVTDLEAIRSRSTVGDQIRRLALHDCDISLSNFQDDLNHLRTLQVHKLSDHHILEIVLKTNRFLKVLDLQGTALEKFPEYVEGLTLLKYLSLKDTRIKIVPSSIKKLVFLEILDVRYTRVAYLPKQIYELERLRHVLVFRKIVGDGGADLAEGKLGALSASLQKLSLIKVENNRRIIEALGELTGLRKLGVTHLKKEDGKELCRSIQKMKNLSSFEVRSTSMEEYLDLDHMQSPLVAPIYLQRLYMEGCLASLPKWIPELTSITKIVFKSSKLNVQANPLEALRALPNLIELILVNFYTGKKLIFEVQTFKKLMILSIEQFSQLSSMKFEDGAMCELKDLTISKCQKLKSLPSGMGDLPLLNTIRWNDMPPEVKDTLDLVHRQKYPHIQIKYSY